MTKLRIIFNLFAAAKVYLVLLVLAILWLMMTNNADNEKISRNASYRSSDNSMGDFTMILIYDDGRPFLTVQGKEMLHYFEDDIIEIIDPIARFIEPEQEAWVVTSNKGTTLGKGEIILLIGNVVITQENNDKIKLLTEKISLDTVNNTAYTDLAITINSPYGEMHSVGFNAAIKERTINLHSQIRGIHYIPKFH